MCSLCGVLGGAEHWTDTAARPGIFTRNTDSLSRRRERMQRVALANRILKNFGMNLTDWQGASYLLSTVTGKTEIVDNLTHLWAVAEVLSGRLFDPLDPSFIERMEASNG